MHPSLLQFGHLSLPTFGALAALGLMLALWLSQRTARMAGVDAERLWNAGLACVVAAFVVSRVLLVLEHFGSFRRYPVLLLAVPSLTPGGLLLTVVATLVWLRWRGVDVRRALDAWAPCGLLVWAMLALGHFMEGSDPGMASGYGLQVGGDALRTYPVALYSFGVAVGLGALVYWWLGRSGRRGETAGLALAGAGVGQFLLGFLRVPGVDAGAGLDALQWVALGMMVGGVGLVGFGWGEGQRMTADVRG